MATLLEFDEKIRNTIEFGCDLETGEILSDDELYALLEKLEMDKEKKIDNIATYIKVLEAEALAIKAEKDKLASRQKSKENKAESLKRFISGYMQFNGMTKFETPKNVLSFRKSTKLSVDEDKFLKKYRTKLCEKIITYKYDKNELKKMVQAGEKIVGVEIVENLNLQIK